jgi:hypothetical protein
VQGLARFVHSLYIQGHGCVGIAVVLVLFSACAPSPKPQVSPIEDIAAPTFDGANLKRLTVSTQHFTVGGTCDAKADGLQYSLDKSTWKDLSGGCPSSGLFSISASVTRTLTLFVRAKSKSGFTAAAEAEVTFTPPPTASSLTFVAASSSSDDKLPNVISAMGHSITGAPLSNNVITVNSYLPGMIYGAQ